MQRIGVIGLGIMGSAMAHNLLKAGFDVWVYNRTSAKSQALKEAGAKVAQSPRTLAEAVSIISIIVTNPKALWDILTGPEGLLACPGAGRIILQDSTIDLTSTKDIAEACHKAGYRFLDAPVTGSKKQVEAGELIFEIGGAAEVLKEAQPALEAMGKKIVLVGDIGAGTALKLCMNLIVAQMTSGLAEAVTLAKALKIDPVHIFEVLKESTALNCAYFQIKKEPLLSFKYPPAFSLANMLKDLGFMNRAAAQAGLKLPITTAVEQLMKQAAEAGFAESDLSSIAEILQRP